MSYPDWPAPFQYALAEVDQIIRDALPGIEAGYDDRISRALGYDDLKELERAGKFYGARLKAPKKRRRGVDSADQAITRKGVIRWQKDEAAEAVGADGRLSGELEAAAAPAGRELDAERGGLGTLEGGSPGGKTAVFI